MVEKIAFGLLHPSTNHIARYVYTEEEVAIFHRLNPEKTMTTYRDQEDELADGTSFFEWDVLGDLLQFIKTNEWDHWNDEPDLDDFSDFVPIAFIRGMRRLGGNGDFFDGGLKIMLVTPKDDEGKTYDLSEIL